MRDGLTVARDQAPDGIESASDEVGIDHRAETRLWLNLLACTTLIGTEIRRQFRQEFDFTLPRFEVLAQLEREPGGLVLGGIAKTAHGYRRQPHSDHRSSRGGKIHNQDHLDRRSSLSDCLPNRRRQKGVPTYGQEAWRLACFDSWSSST